MHNDWENAISFIYAENRDSLMKIILGVDEVAKEIHLLVKDRNVPPGEHDITRFSMRVSGTSKREHIQNTRYAWKRFHELANQYDCKDFIIEDFHNTRWPKPPAHICFFDAQKIPKTKRLKSSPAEAYIDMLNPKDLRNCKFVVFIPDSMIELAFSAPDFTHICCDEMDAIPVNGGVVGFISFIY